MRAALASPAVTPPCQSFAGAAAAGLLIIPLLATGCTNPRAMSGPVFARLDSRAPATSAFALLRSEFKRRNPGNDVEWHHELKSLKAAATQVVFVQSGTSQATAGKQSSPVTVGDIVVLRPGETLVTSPAVAALVFAVPQSPPDSLPAFIRPDWDPRITDTPGGCATETGAYRRILLTWQERNGPYTWHALNAHRVRITDSFTHYHPLDGGFDEFYLVQMAGPESRLITSRYADRIARPETLTRRQTATLLETHRLHVGDLVYLPRGVVHRGVGGALAQVITVPGFKPGAEIGVDHHLAEINRRLGLEGSNALPFNEQNSTAAVIR